MITRVVYVVFIVRVTVADVSVFRDEVSQHASESSCWLAIDGVVYDMTNFLNEHPGGKKALLREAGKDATDSFDAVHSRELLEKYKDQL